MELRNHPLMSHDGVSNWPPVWAPVNRRDGKPSLQGEIGVLKFVVCPPSRKVCFLITVHDGGEHIGRLLFDDGSFCQQIGKILETYIGRTIKEIGDLDLAHLL